MKIFLALLFSFLLHCVVLLLLMQQEESEKPQVVNKENTKVKLVSLLHAEKQQLIKQPEILPLKKSESLTEIKKTELLPQKKLVSLPFIEVPLPVKIDPKESVKQVVKEQIKEPVKEQIKEAKNEVRQDVKTDAQLDKITKSYLELYKEDFDTFSEDTKVYLIKNLKDIGRITQRFLIFPYIAVQAHQQGINVVEFMLYPDGKISKPTIIKSSTYHILDDNTEDTIKKAYRDYPRPEKPTIIRIYVKYTIT